MLDNRCAKFQVLPKNNMNQLFGISILSKQFMRFSIRDLNVDETPF